MLWKVRLKASSSFSQPRRSYDHHHYGEYALVAMPVADSPQILGKLLDQIPQRGVVFKVLQDADAMLIAARFGGHACGPS